MSARPIDSACGTSANNMQRETTRDSETSDRLKLYALAAAAAGVSILALGQPAESEVVVTKKTIPIPVSQEVEISLTNNGVDQFAFNFFSFAYKSISYRQLSVHPLSSKEAGVVLAPGGANDVMDLARGVKIGPSADFSDGYGALVEATSITSRGAKVYTGSWGGNPKNRYVGLRFFINGETHYGWVRLTVNTSKQQIMSATITAYAYETVPNRRILAGVSRTTAVGAKAEARVKDARRPGLGMLALGVNGLPMWRREESVGSR